MNPLKRRHALALLAATALVASVASAWATSTTGSGNPASEARNVGSFQAISLHGAIDLVVRQGPRESVQVRADDNLLPLVRAVVEDIGGTPTLRIDTQPGESMRSRTPIVVTVEVQRLMSLASSGSGDVIVEALKTPSLMLSLSGSSDAKLRRIETDKLRIGITGSGDVQASGRAAQLDISIAGSGDVQTRELAANEVAISIAGSGDARVSAQKTISVSIAGSGDVEYGGGATLASSRIAGSGSVRLRKP
jgi:Putative auto-transporter adhesin, head GIN domain